MSYFYYEVEHFNKTWSVMTWSQCTRREEGEVEKYQMVEQLKRQIPIK